MDKEVYNPHEKIDISRMMRVDKKGFLELCGKSGYDSNVFDYCSKENNEGYLEKALEIARKLEGIPQEEIKGVLRKLEVLYKSGIKVNDTPEYNQIEHGDISYQQLNNRINLRIYKSKLILLRMNAKEFGVEI